VHAIAIALSLSLSLAPGPETTAEVQPEAPVEPAEPEPLPDIVPEPEPTPEVEPAPEPEPPPEVEPTPEPPPPADDQALAASVTQPPVRDRLGCNGSKPCRKMSVAGIVVGSLGLVSIGVGVGLLVRPDEVVPESPTFVKSTHPPGLVAVTIGTGIALTSALMLGAAHKGYKPRAGKDKAARVQIGPTGLRF
jgi:outer membrane biosynthesis protein TonB